MRRHETVDERFVETLPFLDHVGDRVLRFQSQKQRQVAGLKIEIDEHGFGVRRCRSEVRRDERSAAAAFAGKHGDHAAFLLGASTIFVVNSETRSARCAALRH